MACSAVPAIAPDQMLRRVCAAPQEMMKPKAPPVVVAAPAPAPVEPPLSATDLDIIGQLGDGGFARVYMARHCRTGEVFALKISIDLGLHVLEEAKVLCRAAGAPHVVNCHALLEWPGPGGEVAFVLEYMDAGSLDRILRLRRGLGLGMPEAAVAEVAAQCVLGLAHLHSRGIAHLDVKPDNLLANTRGEVKISDFNTSRILYGGAGESLFVSMTSGTSKYFSPERFVPKAHAGPHGAMAADVWSLGLTVLELFLGRFPIQLPAALKPSLEQRKRAICDAGEALSVPEEAEASEHLRGFVSACLHKNPMRRATVAQLMSHPFLTLRDVDASRCALRDIILTLTESFP